MDVRVGLAFALLLASGIGSSACTREQASVSAPPINAEPVPIEGQLLSNGDGAIFGALPPRPSENDPDLTLVELLTAQTGSSVHIGAEKVDAVSYLYEVDCGSLEYRLLSNGAYERAGKLLGVFPLSNDNIDGPMAPYLRAACEPMLAEAPATGRRFASMEEFLAMADQERLENPGRLTSSPPIIVPTPE